MPHLTRHLANLHSVHLCASLQVMAAAAAAGGVPEVSAQRTLRARAPGGPSMGAESESEDELDGARRNRNRSAPAGPPRVPPLSHAGDRRPRAPCHGYSHSQHASAALTDREKHEITCALLDAARIVSVRFSISRDFWKGYPFHNELPERVFGTFERWLNVAARKPKIKWDDGGEDTDLALEDLLPVEYAMQLEKYAGTNKDPPRPRKRRNVAEGAGPSSSAHIDQADPNAQTVDIEYKAGSRDLVQTWTYRTPEAIVHDVRLKERHRPAINRDSGTYSTPFHFFLNVALPLQLIKKMFAETGWINQRLTGKDNSYFHRKTSIGEGLQFMGYMIALANNPGAPIKSMWSEKVAAGVKSVLPAPNIGRFGMSENRFERLKSLVPLCYSTSMAELDTADPWRYVSPMIDAFNAHWIEAYFPSWLLSPDELMCPWTPDEGNNVFAMASLAL